MSERPTREAWVLSRDGERVLHVTGYQCLPENPDYWWFPTAGASVHESAIYATYDAARSVAIANLRARRESIEGAIADLAYAGEQP